MTTLLLYLIPVAILGVVVALILGMRAFLGEGAENRRRSNKMMQWRIGLQFIAVLLIFLFVLLAGGG